MKLISAVVSIWTAICVHSIHSDPAKGNRMQRNEMLLLRTSAGIVCRVILFQSLNVPPDTVQFIHTEIIGSTVHIFILLHGLMIKFLILGWRTDLILFKRVTEGQFEPQIRENFVCRSKSMDGAIFK
jgi:hypothetical protein